MLLLRKYFLQRNLHENLSKINGEYKENDLVARGHKFYIKR